MFDLEEAIKKWRKSLNANEALEDGDKEELECHLQDKIEFLLEQGHSKKKAFKEALAKIGPTKVFGTEFYRETSRRLSRRPPWEKSPWMPTLLSNYLKIGLRKIKRQKIYSSINVVGLAVGLACCAVIILYVTNELTYDSFHPDIDRIYRVATHRINRVGDFTQATTPGPLGPELKDSYPQVEQAVRVVPPYENSDHVLVVREHNRFFENRVFFVDSNLFQVFRIPFVQGDPKTALVDPLSVVITEGIAALSTTRTQEVGLRRVVGAQGRQLIGQFLGESFLITILAFAGAFGLTSLLITPFNRMAGTELSLSCLSQPVVALSLFGLLILVAVGSGGYPAFILTALKPVSILQGKAVTSSRGTFLQKFLVVGQFAISIFLVISTLTVFKQLDFMRGRALGFDLDQKLLLRVKSNINHLRRDYENIKLDFLQHPSINGATVSSRVPGDRSLHGYWMTSPSEESQDPLFCRVITIDYDFIPEYGIQMVKGRDYDRSLGNDKAEAYVINLAAVKKLGFYSPEEALGKSFITSYHRKTKRIIGVTEDFHFLGMHDVVEPYILDIESSLFSTITLSVRIENMKDLMTFIEKKWNDHFPEVPFEYTFLDENFDRLYRYEEQMSKLLGIITGLGFVIACLGLFGLASFVVRRRTKEIAIRKVLGASTADIISILSRKFVLLILLSVTIALPLAFIAMNRWLQDFAFRIELSGIIFLITAAGALGIAIATVSLQGFLAASSNPVNSLRDE